MEGSKVPLFTCLLRENNYYYKCLVDNDCCNYISMGLKGVVEHLSFNHGISYFQNIDFYIIKESNWFTIDEDSE